MLMMLSPVMLASLFSFNRKIIIIEISLLWYDTAFKNGSVLNILILSKSQLNRNKGEWFRSGFFTTFQYPKQSFNTCSILREIIKHVLVHVVNTILSWNRYVKCGNVSFYNRTWIYFPDHMTVSNRKQP